MGGLGPGRLRATGGGRLAKGLSGAGLLGPPPPLQLPIKAEIPFASPKAWYSFLYS